MPDGNYVDLTYDSRDRLTKSRDLAGNEQRYTYDSVDNPITTEAWATLPSSSRKRTQTFTVDLLDRVTQVQGSTTSIASNFTYDAAGRQTTATDPNLVQSTQVYDDLDRLIATVADSASGGLQATTGMSYDAVGHLRGVVDPKGLATTYVYDALGRLTQQNSPDSGTTSYTYDDAGNRASKTDARNVTATYTYDALNRPLTITFPTAAENVVYLYDTPNTVCQTGETFSQGRLSKLTDQSGTTEFCYDRFGHIVRKVQTVGGQVQVVRYTYDLANRLASLTYPDGTVADYLRDTQGRVKEVGVTATGGTRQILLNNAKYLPDGPASSWQYGNGRTLARTYDLDYRATGVRDPGAGGLDIGYVYDSGSYLTQVTTQSTALVRAKFEYDALGRMRSRKSATDVVQESYSYDTTGNRLTAGEWYTVSDPNAPPGGGGTIDQFSTLNYTYAVDSHRLTAVGSEPRAYSANGNLLSIGDPVAPGGLLRSEYIYNDANRMSIAKQNGVISGTYLYNGLGEQVQRQTGVTTRFVYDESGQLLGQYDNAGGALQQYVWLEGQPIGMMVSPTQAASANARLKYVESDALGTPRAIIDPTRSVAIWRWDEMKEGFGDHAPESDPDGDGVQLLFDLRFAGQRYDAASGLHYNYMRDFDPSVGRYTQSDPLGLLGGINTYSYVGGNPLAGIDPSGLVYGDGVLELEDVFFGPTVWMREQMGLTQEFSQAEIDFTFGFFDNASFGLSSLTRKLMGNEGFVNECSSAYSAGGWAAVAFDLLTGSGLVKGGLKGLAKANIWSMRAFKRGQVLEQMFGHNLPGNFPVIDRFANGIATSIKSLNLNAKTYQSASRLSRTLTGYVNKVASFNGRTWAGVTVRSGDITGRALDLIVPGSGSPAQRAAIQQAIQYATSRGVSLNLIIYP
jgi:RHS repeat-associated protein